MLYEFIRNSVLEVLRVHLYDSNNYDEYGHRQLVLWSYPVKISIELLFGKYLCAVLRYGESLAQHGFGVKTTNTNRK